MRPLSRSVGVVTAPGHHQLATHSKKEVSLHTCADAVRLWMEQAPTPGSHTCSPAGGLHLAGLGLRVCALPVTSPSGLVAWISLPRPEQLGESPGVTAMRPGHGTPRLTTLPFGPGWPSIPVTPWMNDIETKETENEQSSTGKVHSTQLGPCPQCQRTHPLGEGKGLIPNKSRDWLGFSRAARPQHRVGQP